MLVIKFLMGIPASGKSTYARSIVTGNDNYIRVNKDDIREQCMCGMWSKVLEKTVLVIRDSIIENALKAGKNIIVDDTNFHHTHFKTVLKIAHKVANETGQIVGIEKMLFHITKEEAIERDSKRGKPVGEAVINKMWGDYEKIKDHTYDMFFVEPLISEKDKYVYNMELPSTIICDLDGTLCLFDGNPYDRDFSKDECNEAVLKIIRDYYRRLEVDLTDDMQIMFFSGRDNKFREVTNNWIHRHLGFLKPEHYNLYMRPTGDSRPDTVLKKEMFDVVIRDKYNIDYVLDDRKKICEMWYNMGLPVFRFGNPNLDF